MRGRCYDLLGRCYKCGAFGAPQHVVHVQLVEAQHMVRHGGRQRYPVEERLRLAKKYGILVDPEDEWLLSDYTWTIHSSGYPATWMTLSYRVQRVVYLHHCIVGQAVSQRDEVCHLDRNKMNCRRSNLVIQSVSKGKRLNSNVLRAKHVMFDMRAKRWHVKINRDRVQYHRLNLRTEADAHAAKAEWVAAYEVYGEDTWMKLSGEWRITKRASLPSVSRRRSLRPQTC
jgi:hypothetical protein